MDKCAGLPKLYGIAIRATDLFRDRIIREAGDPKGHVVVARAHAAEFKETADLVENFANPAPCKSGMRVVVRAAIVFPEFRSLWHNRLPGVKDAREAQVGMEVIIVRPKILGSFPGLGDGVELKGMNGLCSPSGLAEMNVGIECPDIFCVMWEPGNPDVQAVFLRPCESRRAHGNMRDAHMLAEIGKIVATRAVGDLGDRHMNIRLAKPIRDRGATATLDFQRTGFAIIVTTCCLSFIESHLR
jgi:hypothetical protein